MDADLEVRSPLFSRPPSALTRVRVRRNSTPRDGSSLESLGTSAFEANFQKAEHMNRLIQYEKFIETKRDPAYEARNICGVLASRRASQIQLSFFG